MPIDRPPPFDEQAARLGEQPWLEEEARLARSFVIAAIWLVGGLAATYLAASFAYPILARLFCIVVFGGMARVVYLCIQRHRTFIAVKTAAGMTKGQALSESNRRFGG
jgi:hypothetical protein